MTKSLSKGWRHDRLKDVAAINRQSLGASTDPNAEVDYLEISNVNSLGIVDRSEIEHLRFADAPSRARRCVSEGATIISSVRPNLQAVAFIDAMDSGLICSTGFNVVEPIQHKLVPRYLYYYLLSDDAKQYFVATAKGVGYPAIDDKEFSTVDVPLPPLPEQKRIAAFLDAKCADIDKAIEAKRKQLGCIDEMWKNILLKATVYGIDGEQLKPSGDVFFPEIPKGWRVLKTLHCLSMPITDGPHTTPELFDDGVPFVSAEAVSNGNGRIDFSRIRGYISEEFYEECCKKYIPQIDDVYMVKSGATTGRVAIVDDARKFTIWSPLAAFRSREYRMTAKYLYYAIQSPYYTKQVELNWSFGTQQNIGMRVLERLKLFVPPMDQQYRIVAHLDAKRKKLDELTDNLRRQIEVLADYRKSLIHECVIGERRVG